MAKTRTVELIAKLRNNMTPGLRKLASGATMAAGAIVAMGTAAFAAAKKLSDYGAEIFDVASATGVAVEDIQALGYAFEQTGGSMSSMSGAIRGLNTFMRTAATGSAEYINVLNTLGLEYDTLRAMEPAEAFIQITDAIGGLDTAMEKNIAATTVFGGRYAQQITGALDQAGGSLSTLTDQFTESGNAMSGEQIQALKSYSDALTDLEFAMKKLTADAIGPMLPKLQDMAEKGMNLARDVLPQLIPMVESAINVMIDTLPVAIRLLGTAAEGWDRISDSVKNGIGGSDAEELMNALTRAVETGAITAEQAAAEWEGLTREGRSAISTFAGMINPVTGMTHVVQDASAAYGIFGDQQITVNDELNNTALAAFRAAEGFTAVTTAATVSTTSAMAQANAMGMVALAYSNFLNAGEEVDDEETPAGRMDSAIKKAEEFKINLKAIMEEEFAHAQRMIEITKAQKDAEFERIEAERDAEFERIEAAGMAQAEADQARADALTKANAKTMQMTENIIGAALSGKDAWNSYWDNMRNQILKTVAMKGFMALMNFATGGAFGGIVGTVGGFLGFKGGGTVPHYAAAGGMTIPGATTSFGDKVPFMGEPGEVVLSRSQAQDLQGGGGTTTVSVDYRPMFSSASSGDIARMVPVLKKAMEKGNLI